MQKIATKIFMVSSLAFGVLGILIVLLAVGNSGDSFLNEFLLKSLMVSVFIILPSFAFSVAGKYLDGRR